MENDIGIEEKVKIIKRGSETLIEGKIDNIETATVKPIKKSKLTVFSIESTVVQWKKEE